MAYAADGRMATASSSGGTLQTNTYDATGSRVKKVASSTTTRFVKGLGGELLQESDGTNTLNYIYSNGVPIAQFNTGGTLTYLHTDQRGAPVKATNGSKATQWSTSYDPFGQTIGLSNPGSLTMNLRLPGQYYDAETGLYDNGFRSYNPFTGRYMQSDPIGLAGGANTYGYVTGNPFSKVDPLGLADSFNSFMGVPLSGNGSLYPTSGFSAPSGQIGGWKYFPSNVNESSSGFVFSSVWCSWGFCISSTINEANMYFGLGWGWPGFSCSLVHTNNMLDYSSGWTNSGGLGYVAGGYNETSWGNGFQFPPGFGGSRTWSWPVSQTPIATPAPKYKW